MSNHDEPVVVDDRSSARFILRQDGAEAQLIYRVDDDRLILLHTEVPAMLGGRGIGGRLARAAVERAARDTLTVLPWCPYARRWLQEHPDVAGRVVVDWTPPPDE